MGTPFQMPREHDFDMVRMIDNGGTFNVSSCDVTRPNLDGTDVSRTTAAREDGEVEFDC